MCGGFPTLPNHPWIPAGCPETQFSSDMNYPEIASLWNKLRAQSHKTAQLPSDASWNPRCDLCFWPTGCKSEVPTTPSILVLAQFLSCVRLSEIPWTQHTRFPCLSLSPRVCSNACPLSWYCLPSISSSVTPFSSCSKSFPYSWSFPVSQLFSSSGQSIGASASASVLPMNI